MDMFPHTVTLYHELTETDPATFQDVTAYAITLLRGVLLDEAKAANVTKSGLKSADAVNLYIPADVRASDGVTGAPKRYAGAAEFRNADDPSGLWTLTVDGKTFFVRGEAVHPDWDAQKLEAAYDGVYNVTNVDFKDFGGEMRHWEVGGA